ncbi:MAG: hypothetical protein V9G09_11210 [Candidatus Nanopelagicales bacterium]
MPLVVVETKTPVSASVSWLNGARDIANVYERGQSGVLRPERAVRGDGGP